MKALVKCKFYLMMLFVAVLFTVSTAASDDQTKLSTRDTTQMEKKTDDHDSRQRTLSESRSGRV